MKTYLKSLLIIFMGAFVSHAPAAQFTGKVVGISDGDSLTLLTDENEQIKVRLAHIDAPEKKQPYGQASKQALSDLVFSKMILADCPKKDRYRRQICDVFVGDIDVQAELVKSGAVWVYTKYNKRPELVEYEATAREAKIGLWSLQPDQIMPPWEWRKR